MRRQQRHNKQPQATSAHTSVSGVSNTISTAGAAARAAAAATLPSAPRANMIIHTINFITISSVSTDPPNLLALGRESQLATHIRCFRWKSRKSMSPLSTKATAAVAKQNFPGAKKILHIHHSFPSTMPLFENVWGVCPPTSSDTDSFPETAVSARHTTLENEGTVACLAANCWKAREHCTRRCSFSKFSAR